MGVGIMLVSMFARMNAISQMHNAQYALLRNSMNVRNLMHSISFGGNYNMAALAEMDKQIALSNARNELTYKIACAQKEALDKSINKEIQDNAKSLSYMA